MARNNATIHKAAPNKTDRNCNILPGTYISPRSGFLVLREILMMRNCFSAILVSLTVFSVTSSPIFGDENAAIHYLLAILELDEDGKLPAYVLAGDFDFSKIPDPFGDTNMEYRKEQSGFTLLSSLTHHSRIYLSFGLAVARANPQEAIVHTKNSPTETEQRIREVCSKVSQSIVYCKYRYGQNGRHHSQGSLRLPKAIY